MASVPVGKETLTRWMKHQNVNVETQVASRNGELFTVNGLYTGKLKEEMHAVHRFLLEHPKEVVLLHFSPVLPFPRSDFEALEKALRLHFDDLLLTEEDDLDGKSISELSLKDIWNAKRQVILLCDAAFTSPLMWNDVVNRIQPAHGDVQAVEDLLEEDRDKDESKITVLVGAASLCLTNVLEKPFGSFEKEYGRPSTRSIASWVEKKADSLLPCVVSAHFVDEGTFCKSVIQLNY